jgi:hypothetical protein
MFRIPVNRVTFRDDAIAKACSLCLQEDENNDKGGGYDVICLGGV